MTPLCVGGCGQPVKRHAGGNDTCVRGRRVLSGVRWRWYCSRACASDSVDRVENARRGAATYRARIGQARIREVAELLKPYAPQGFPKDELLVLAGFIVRRERKIYLRGYQACRAAVIRRDQRAKALAA